MEGHPRRFIVYVPATAPVTGPRRPVVFMHHGTGGDGAQFLRISGWREQADATGLVAVFPDALRYRVLDSGNLKSKWNAFDLADEIDTGELPPGSDPGAPVPADDVGFVDTMLGDLDAGLPIDRHRIYASGFSNGAGFTARLGVERSETIAAVAYTGGGLPSEQSPTRPVPSYGTVGSLDAKILDNADAPLSEFPLEPLQILRDPTIGPFLEIALRTQGLGRDSFGVDTAAALDPAPLAGRRHRAERRAVQVRHARRRDAPVPERGQQPARIGGRAGVLGLLLRAPAALNHPTGRSAASNTPIAFSPARSDDGGTSAANRVRPPSR